MDPTHAVEDQGARPGGKQQASDEKLKIFRIKQFSDICAPLAALGVAYYSVQIIKSKTKAPSSISSANLLSATFFGWIFQLLVEFDMARLRHVLFSLKHSSSYHSKII